MCPAQCFSFQTKINVIADLMMVTVPYPQNDSNLLSIHKHAILKFFHNTVKYPNSHVSECFFTGINPLFYVSKRLSN